jgi:phosphoserine aminotransferase
MSYKTHADKDSMYNTPNCWAIYCCGKVFRYLLDNGGLEAMAQRNEEKAKVLYDYLDQSELFKGTVVKEDRSLMNVPFSTGDADTDADVVAETKKAGFDNLKGHRSVGGLRASIYNAMPKEGVEALVAFLKNYEESHR